MIDSYSSMDLFLLFLFIQIVVVIAVPLRFNKKNALGNTLTITVIDKVLFWFWMIANIVIIALIIISETA